MSVVLFKNLLAKLQKANQKARGAQAVKAGFQTYEEYKAYLQEQIKNCSTNVEEKVIQEVPDKVKKVESKKKVVHTIDLVDASGSMVGSRINKANQAIKKGVELLKKDTVVENYYSLWEFSYRENIRCLLNREKSSNIEEVPIICPTGWTALYLAIKTVIEKNKNEEGITLLNVYTDGGDNLSTSEDIRFVKEYIKNNKQNFVVTFVGTGHDVNSVTRTLGLDSSNTLTYDGSAQGLKDVMQKTTASRAAFSEKVANNDTTFNTGFYKDFK